jgi:hypothetical protein
MVHIEMNQFIFRVEINETWTDIQKPLLVADLIDDDKWKDMLLLG